MTHRVAVIGGDGIGPEVCAEAVKVMQAAGADIAVTPFDLGGARYVRTGDLLPEPELEQLRGYDAILLGAVGTPEVTPGILEQGLLLALRREFDQYINLRPFYGASHRIDVIRENTEGSYLNEGGVLRKGTDKEVATQGSVNTRFGVERCIRFAFAHAMNFPRKKLTLVHKTNVLMFSGGLWKRTFDEVATEFPGVSVDYNHVDAACIYLVEDPGRYDVIVTDNLFGDILTDLAGAVSGGVGAAASACLDPERRNPSTFEPVHGSAPDIAGTGKANPVAAIRSAAMMLEFLGETDSATRINKALDGYEPIGSTSEIGDAIAGKV